SQQGYSGDVPPSTGYVASSIEYIYDNYAVTYNKPFVISESSYAWEFPLSGGSFDDTITQGDAQKVLEESAYWGEILSTSFLDSHPLFKMIFVFEYIKPEDSMMRDFRVSWNASVLSEFVPLLDALDAGSRLVWANTSVATPTHSASSSSSTSSTSSATSTSTSASATASTTTKSSTSGAAARHGAELGALSAAVAAAAVAGA
ncbi:hypothetical protein HK405_001773, partial [Cladochytrium tenue]